MKAINYIKKIQSENACSIHTAELLTAALHREERLSPKWAVRFRPMYGDFDLVNSDFEKVGVTVSKPVDIYYLEAMAEANIKKRK